MNRRYRKKRKDSKVREIVTKHIENNIKNYVIISIIFLIGVVIGVIFINNNSENQYNETTSYIQSLLQDLKENHNIDNALMLKDSIEKNIVLVVTLWFMGSTVIGISVVYFIIGFRGFCLSYTISSIIFSLGCGKGMLFLITALLLQTILFIPSILALAVSGMRFHSSIMQDKKKENIKLEILRHTLFSLLILFILILSSLVEVYISKNILLLIIKYI